jgi:hypothetical protein
MDSSGAKAKILLAHRSAIEALTLGFFEEIESRGESNGSDGTF